MLCIILSKNQVKCNRFFFLFEVNCTEMQIAVILIM